MQTANPTKLQTLLIDNISQDVVLAIDEAFDAGSRDAFQIASNMHPGHRAHALGTLRHYRMKEAFAQALGATGGSPSPLRGNALVIGRAGIFHIARLNMHMGPWYHARRSRQRRMLAAVNAKVETLVQPDLFESTAVVNDATVFFVAVFADSIGQDASKPISTVIAIPDADLKRWLYFEPLQDFLEAYNRPAAQQDKAVPKLKGNIKRKDGTEGSS